MRIRFLAAALLLSGAAPLAGQQQSAQQPPAGPAFAQLLARVKAGDPNADYTALRMAYVASPQYVPEPGRADPHADSVEPALDRNDFRRAVSEADAALASNYMDIRTHLARAYALAQLGDTAASSQEHRFAAGMIRSIAASGQGSQQSPYVVVSVAEEYAFLLVHGYRPTGQALDECNGHPCDELRGVDDDGHEASFFFDVSLLKAAFTRRLQHH